MNLPDPETIRGWLQQEGFAGLVGHLRFIIEETRQQLLDEGMSPDLVDDEVTNRMFAVAVSLAAGKTLTAAAEQTTVDKTTIREWLDEAGFQTLLEQIRQLILMIRERLSERGMPAGLVDDEAAEQLYEWALIAGLVTPRPIPAARPARHRPWLRLLRGDI